jgi:hypothetical protein
MIYYYDYLSREKNQVPEDVCAHIAECAYCQQELHSIQQIDVDSETDSPLTSEQTTHLELHFALAYQPIKCSTIKAFLPVLAIPGHQVTIPTPVTTHINYCSDCRKELKALIDLDLTVLQYGYVSQMFSDHAVHHPEAFSASQIEAISEMLKRPDSGTITCFRLRDPLKNEAGETYEVEVSTETPDTAIPKLSSVPAPEKSRLFASKRQWFRPLAAAAVLMIGIFLLFHSASLQATDIGQIYEALKNVTNITIAQYDADGAAPIGQTWICKQLGVKLTRTNDSYTEWNITNKTQTISTPQIERTLSVPLDQITIDSVSKTMEAPYGLLPFKNVSELPHGAVWEKVQPQETGPNAVATETYNLFWTQASENGTIKDYQWQFHIDAVTKHPIKVEVRQKEAGKRIFELITTFEITYPTQAQVQEILAETGL